ncbi:unnamed protein product [Strongylus vulgaris]|uniref:SSD domain-containing protein n=1 Tax=Strongylus vulgaris TaxID=40348 RepID=A0A3P7JY18_STRVU|nr:unnamed protein product [Strongylus vulgaris]
MYVPSVGHYNPVLSFGVGTFTDIIAVEGFCAMTSACMFFTWLYQITFFAGLMVVSAKVELAGRNSVLPCIKVRRTSNLGHCIPAQYLSILGSFVCFSAEIADLL